MIVVNYWSILVLSSAKFGKAHCAFWLLSRNFKMMHGKLEALRKSIHKIKGILDLYWHISTSFYSPLPFHTIFLNFPFYYSFLNQQKIITKLSLSADCTMWIVISVSLSQQKSYHCIIRKFMSFNASNQLPSFFAMA